MKPKVSLITPIYRVEPYIAKYARSLFAQTYPEIQFIFVDDGTPDRSIEVLNEVIDKEFPGCREQILILHRENGGLPQARLTGLQKADGDYILYVDSDDWVETDYVEKMVGKALESGSDIVYCDYFKHYDKRTSIGREAEYAAVEPLLTDLIHGVRFHGFLWNKLIRRELFFGIDLAWPRANTREDLVISFQQLYYARKVTHLPETLYHYRRNNAGSLLHLNKVTSRAQCSVNHMVLYDHYRGKEKPNPVSVIESDFLAQTGWFMYKSDSVQLLEQYPYLPQLLLDLPACSERFLRRIRVRRWVRNWLRNRGKA